MNLIAWLFVVLIWIVPSPSLADPITNGTAVLSWDDPGSNQAIIIQYQSFADATWKSFTLGTPILSTARYEVTGSFPPFQPDTLTDHFICIRAQWANATDKTMWAPGNCVQVPVPVVVPPQPPSNLTITQLDVNRVKIEASINACKSIRTTGSGLTRTVRCVPRS